MLSGGTGGHTLKANAVKCSQDSTEQTLLKPLESFVNVSVCVCVWVITSIKEFMCQPIVSDCTLWWGG